MTSTDLEILDLITNEEISSDYHTVHYDDKGNGAAATSDQPAGI